MRKNRICSGATDAEIAVVAKDWFRKIAREEENRGKKKKENGIERATITQEELSMIE